MRVKCLLEVRVLNKGDHNSRVAVEEFLLSKAGFPSIKQALSAVGGIVFVDLGQNKLEVTALRKKSCFFRVFGGLVPNIAHGEGHGNAVVGITQDMNGRRSITVNFLSWSDSNRHILEMDMEGWKIRALEAGVGVNKVLEMLTVGVGVGGKEPSADSYGWGLDMVNRESDAAFPKGWGRVKGEEIRDVHAVAKAEADKRWSARSQP